PSVKRHNISQGKNRQLVQYSQLRDVIIGFSMTIGCYKAHSFADYFNIIVHNLYSCIESIFPTGNKDIQQDSSPCHKVEIAPQWFKEQAD
ncbi:hypothetical protein NPIL_463091, partial [Nephila pilipes]